MATAITGDNKSNTMAYLKSRFQDFNDNDNDFKNNLTKGGSFSIGNTDERYKFAERCGDYMLASAFIFGISLAFLFALVLTLYHYYHNPEEFNKNEEYIVNFGYSALSILIVAIVLYIAAGLWLDLTTEKGRKSAKSLDASLTDITRLSTMPMAQKEVHNTLTNIISKRLGMEGVKDIGQLHYNISNSIIYKNGIEDPAVLGGVDGGTNVNANVIPAVATVGATAG